MQIEGLISATRRLGQMEFTQVPGTSLQNFDTGSAAKLKSAYTEAATRLRRQIGKLQAVIDMDRCLLSASGVDEMFHGALPLIAEILRSRSVSVVLLDESAPGTARSIDFLTESTAPIASARMVTIDEGKLQAAQVSGHSAQSSGLEVHAVGVDAEAFLMPLVACGAQAFRFCPIQDHGQVRGFLCVGYRVDAHALEETGVSVDEICERLALALTHRAHAVSVLASTSNAPVQASRPRSPLETGLHRALQREEFALAYQPIVSADERRVIAVEALVRWPNGTNGASRSAAEFIPVAEDSGLIVDLGDWVLRTACAQFNNWRRDGLTLDYIAVNISAHQLRHTGLLATVLACLQSNHMEPHELQLEITEEMMNAGPQAMVLLRELFERGVRLALDDFGDGNSTLSAVQNLPLTALKIDRSCVAGLADSEQVRSLVRAVIGIGAATGKQVIAEGVEQYPQLRFLEAAGCNALQGYLFSKPMPAAELPAYIHAQSEAPSMVA
jgi:EAL domain-containing protein (putative c-di-GMP-specific phosphodiesterase class I)